MTTTYATVYLKTSSGNDHIFSGAFNDGTATDMTDIITGQGLTSLQGQSIVATMAWTDGYIGQGNGLLILNEQNTPVATIPVNRIEMQQPKWLPISTPTIRLNWALNVTTKATAA